MPNTVKYDVSSRIENGVTILKFTDKKDVRGIIIAKGKYVARIGFNGHKHLGTFETREEAVKMRLLAEEKVKNGTFEQWYKGIKKRGNKSQ